MVVLVAEISSVKIPKAFLICSGVQLNFCVHFHADIPHRLLSPIFKFLSIVVINE